MESLIKVLSFIVLIFYTGCKTNKDNHQNTLLIDNYMIDKKTIKSKDLLGIFSQYKNHLQVNVSDDGRSVSVGDGFSDQYIFPVENKGEIAMTLNDSIVTMYWSERKSILYYISKDTVYSSGINLPDTIQYFKIGNRFMAKFYYWDRGSKICYFIASDGKKFNYFFFFHDTLKRQVFYIDTLNNSIFEMKK
jgi:hypothetical protein